MFLVKLDYFKQTGKWYSEGEYVTNREELFGIFEEVQSMLDHRLLPGLLIAHSPFYVSIDVPDHPNNHPHLCIPTKWRERLEQPPPKRGPNPWVY